MRSTCSVFVASISLAMLTAIGPAYCLTHSFVYSYGGTKLWLFAAFKQTWIAGEPLNISLNLYLEFLGQNKEVFINRVTVSFSDTNVWFMKSPNTTLNADVQWFDWNLTVSWSEFTHEHGFSSHALMEVEVRYDIIDLYNVTWPFITNEDLQLRLVSNSDSLKLWGGTLILVFITVTLTGLGASAIILWLKIRGYKKKQSATRHSSMAESEIFHSKNLLNPRFQESNNMI